MPWVCAGVLCRSGKTELELGIDKQKLKHTLLLADIENDGILGMDFLKAHQCDLTNNEIKRGRNLVFCKK